MRYETIRADVGLHGGYYVMLGETIVGVIERHFPQWERRTKGRRYVNARGICKRAEYRAHLDSNRLDNQRPMHARTLRDAAQWIISQHSSSPSQPSSDAHPAGDTLPAPEPDGSLIGATKDHAR